MADALTLAMNALRDGLAAALPGRLVTRALVPIGLLTDDELAAGVVSVVCMGEKDYANYRGREADLGTLQVVIVGRLKVAEDDPPSAVEDDEFTLAGEIKAFLARPLPEPVRQALTTGFRQSGQLEHPYGWVAFDCEVMT